MLNYINYINILNLSSKVRKTKMSFKTFLNEREYNLAEVETEYQKFFKEKLADYGVESPEDLSDEDKKKFFNEIESEWEGDTDTDEGEEDLTESAKIQSELEKRLITLQKVTESFGRGGFVYRNLPQELQADSLKIMGDLSAVNGMIEDMIYELGTGSY